MHASVQTEASATGGIFCPPKYLGEPSSPEFILQRPTHPVLASSSKVRISNLCTRRWKRNLKDSSWYLSSHLEVAHIAFHTPLARIQSSSWQKKKKGWKYSFQLGGHVFNELLGFWLSSYKAIWRTLTSLRKTELPLIAIQICDIHLFLPQIASLLIDFQWLLNCYFLNTKINSSTNDWKLDVQTRCTLKQLSN